MSRAGNRSRPKVRSSKDQASIEYLSTFSIGLIILIIAVVVVGLFFFRNGGQTTYIPSTCVISSQLNCIQAAVANNAGVAEGLVVFTNDLGLTIHFSTGSLVMYPSASQSSSFSGSCYPTVAPPGATVICNATLSGFNVQIGQELEPRFQIAYSQCTENQCTVINTTGTSTVSVTKNIPTAGVTLVTFPASTGGISINGNDYPGGTVINFLVGANYSIYADLPYKHPFYGWLSTGGVNAKDALTQETNSWATSSGYLEVAFECFGLMLLANPQYAGSEAANPSQTGLCPAGEFLPTTSSAITATPSSNYWAFSSWSGTSGGYSGISNPGTISNFAQNITDTANYLRCYSLTLYANPSDGGSESVSPQSSGGCNTGFWLTGTSASITATPASIYWIFTGWTGSGSGSYTGKVNPAPITYNSNLTEEANYLPCYQLTLLASPGGAGTESANPSSTGGCPYGYYESDTSVTISASALSTAGGYYVFSSWSGNGYSGSADPISIMMNGPVTETANYNFVPCYTLTLSGAGSQSASPSSSGLCPSGQYISGTYVTITASAPDGYAFTGWSGNAYSGGSNPAGITISGTTSETASYVACYTLSVSGSGGGSVTSSPGSSGACPNGTYPSGTSFTIGAAPSKSPKPGWAFGSWSGSGSGSYSGGSSQASVTLYGNVNEYASFNPCYSTNYGGAGGTPVYISPGGCAAPGSTVTIETYSENGGDQYNFGDWTCTGSGCYSGYSSYASFNIQAPTQEVAHYNPCVDISVCTTDQTYYNATGTALYCQGTGSATDGSGNTHDCFASGQTVNLRATGGSGSFAGWAVNDANGPISVACSKSASFTLTAYTQARAYWCIKPYECYPCKK